MRADRAVDVVVRVGDVEQRRQLADARRDRHHRRRRPPPWRARRSPSRSAASCGKSRWQWWSTSITLWSFASPCPSAGFSFFGFCFRLLGSAHPPRAPHSAGTRRPAPGSTVPGFRRPPSPSALKVRASASCPKSVEQLFGRVRRHRRGQDGNLPHHLGRHIEDRLHALGVGLALGPRLLAGEVAVGVRHHRPHGVEVLGLIACRSMASRALA